MEVLGTVFINYINIYFDQHADRKAILQINYSGNFDEERNRTMF